MTLRTLTPLISFILIPACSQRVDTGRAKYPALVSVSAYSDNKSTSNCFAQAPSFAILHTSSLRDAKANNNLRRLHTEELSKKMAILLEEKGFALSKDSQPNYYIEFDYDIESKTKLINTPNHIPGTTTYTSGSVGSWQDTRIPYSQTSTTSGTTMYTQEEIMLHTTSLNMYIYNADDYENIS